MSQGRTRVWLVTGLATGLALLIAAVLLTRMPAPTPTAPPIVLSPEGMPVMGDLGPEERKRLLDRLQESEEERVGAAEAARRRQLREQLLDQRTR